MVRNMFGILLITAVLDFLANLISGGSELVYLILALLVLSVVRVFNFNISKMYIMKRRGEEFSFGDLLKLDDFSRAWSVSFSLIPKYKVAIISLLIYVVTMILGAFGSGVLMIVAIVAYIVTIADTIERSFQYRYADFEAIMKPDLTSAEIVERTGNFMSGNLLKSFVLDLSFVLNYLLLICLVIGCGFLIKDFVTLASITLFTYLFTIVLYFAISIISVNMAMSHLIFYEDKRVGEEVYEQKNDDVETIV